VAYCMDSRLPRPEAAKSTGPRQVEIGRRLYVLGQPVDDIDTLMRLVGSTPWGREHNLS
jgi:hypothetical protein